MLDTPASKPHAHRTTSGGPGIDAKLARLDYETRLQQLESLAAAWLDARTIGPVTGSLDDQLTAIIELADHLEAAMLEAERQA